MSVNYQVELQILLRGLTTFLEGLRTISAGTGSERSCALACLSECTCAFCAHVRNLRERAYVMQDALKRGDL